ncbi:MAG: hypothetical protein GX175_01890 [Halanaerobiaceae bacterium]|jgi:uncharacterized membrane protein|nr:hypothetical protein [Halanaerobiaceae bacterium]
MKIRDIALIGILSATITAGKLALSFIPNIEIVTLLFMVYTVIFGAKRTLFMAFVFSTIEILMYGLSTWVLGYFVIWPVLILLTAFIQKKGLSEYKAALLAGLFGLSFGFFFAVVESFFYGMMYGITYWVKGIPFDIVHGVSNFLIALFLYKPLVSFLQGFGSRMG